MSALFSYAVKSLDVVIVALLFTAFS